MLIRLNILHLLSFCVQKIVPTPIHLTLLFPLSIPILCSLSKNSPNLTDVKLRSICTPLFQTRVLVTHGVHWLPNVDQILVFVNGEISEMGSYDELLTHNGAFAQFLKTFLLQEDSESEESDPECE